MAFEENPYNRTETENALTTSPVGGGHTVPEPNNGLTREDADVVVSEPGEYERADRNDTVYFADGENIDITGLSHFDASGMTLIGGRHKRGVEPCTLKADDNGPGSAAYNGLFRADSGGVHVEGFRIIGPSWYPERAERYKELEPTDVRCWPGYEHISKDGTTLSQRDDMRTAAFSRGIRIRTDGTVRNMDVGGFAHAAIVIGAKSITPRVAVRYSKVHNTCMPGLGYPITLYNGEGLFEYNYYNAYRHSITGFGYPELGYTDRYSVHGPDAMLTPVDMHCLAENGGSNKDFTAGKYLNVENCTFLAARRFYTPGWYSSRSCPAIGIRGQAARGGDGYHTTNCQFAHLSADAAFSQRNVSFPTDWTFGENQFDRDNWTTGETFGAPVDWTRAGKAPVSGAYSLGPTRDAGQKRHSKARAVVNSKPLQAAVSAD